MKVDRPLGHDSPCRGGRVKAAVGLPAKEVFTHLYETRWDPRVLTDFKRPSKASLTKTKGRLT
ncbi:hypothetical protein CDL15_Pgr014967 [Punica granatum]|uniref:Uncharacterized protein n=1 Tax=Punica granatum TaxID=22663 RepID=A0A218WZZ2_PUNGR|nr:hypothetical protein CDL15_Pgr014967 [Punica granatum]